MIWGKIFGTLVGYMVLKIPGAVLGFVIGHWFDRGYAQNFDQQGGLGRFLFGGANAAHDASYVYTMFAVLGHVAKAKGQVTKADIAQASALMSMFELDSDAREQAQRAFREGKEPTYPLEASVKEFRQAFFGRRDVLQLFLEQLITNVLNDQRIEKAEYDVLLRTAKALGFTKFELDQWLLMQRASQRFHQYQSSAGGQQRQQGQRQYSSGRSAGDNLKDAYDVLGVTAKASDAEVKKAYRKLMARHHPDKLEAQGLPPEMMKAAQAKAQDIQAAYESIKTHRGSKG
ncbi:MAG: co-chaperone DjlA [Idiomarina sp.]